MRRAALNALGQPVGEALDGWRPPIDPPGILLEGRYALLERLAAARHAASLHRANSADGDGRNWTYLPYGPFDSLAAYRAWIEECSPRRDPLFYAIVERASGEALGVASFLRIEPGSGSIEVGHLNFSPRLQRTPAATEALFLMLGHAFELGYRRCEWKCDALNGASRTAARRLGFTFEGIFRQATVIKRRNRDTAWYSIIDGEWPALSSTLARWLDPENFDADGRQRLALSEMTQQLPSAGEQRTCS
ncbi:GNAT family N-acetyltransferase [Accumulibacter sp.]|uniref:GNAT family N-acetyltransferase n=1 Tax=Accumulibacter sp. TaxID=2053492 RepID=UPI0025DA03F5|nr:GNAT family protein [Accumulibacter sp.]MCM8596906.1 GNAT family N-acetyltransferase [Accumulibacter sp.]MCM8624404.1 GNAT family N-acetyltransferase [Accumulibacter sp.]MDS4051054.1 GNAT family protein [Accumulibacter sp.]